ncbi:MAG: hypothetical protein M0R33_18835 [Methylomonas sp.]|jgi:hypothetical protein|uniref:hypothetical protein n=1 Tax=Methylomonas sp. TaxID=418 RepID=UPI0025DF7D9D|nr:hypothetical protein [Methylomonas sp.]MCK9608501.1 hypothetical protein [Methylomonas sp.]
MDANSQSQCFLRPGTSRNAIAGVPHSAFISLEIPRFRFVCYEINNGTLDIDYIQESPSQPIFFNDKKQQARIEIFAIIKENSMLILPDYKDNEQFCEVAAILSNKIAGEHLFRDNTQFVCTAFFRAISLSKIMRCVDSLFSGYFISAEQFAIIDCRNYGESCNENFPILILHGGELFTMQGDFHLTTRRLSLDSMSDSHPNAAANQAESAAHLRLDTPGVSLCTAS